MPFAVCPHPKGLATSVCKKNANSHNWRECAGSKPNPLLINNQESMEETRELTFGEKAVGLTFNPSGDEEVTKIKKLYATIIDICDGLRVKGNPSEKGRLLSVAITEAQTAQMWAVKAITWKD